MSKRWSGGVAACSVTRIPPMAVMLAAVVWASSCGRVGFDSLGECGRCETELACLDAQCIGGQCVLSAAPGMCGIELACVQSGAIGGAGDCGVCDPDRATTEWSRQDGCEFLDHGTLFVGDVAGDRIGTDVAIDGDVVVAGAPYAEGIGKAWVFERGPTGAWKFATKLEAEDAAVGDEFATAVAVDGSTILIGSPLADHSDHVDAGAVYVFERGAMGWSQTAKLVADDADGSDYFGIDVALAGDRAVVGSYYDDDGGNEAGSAYVFERTGSAWAQTAKLVSPAPADQVFFGSSVAVDGDRIVVGAPYETLTAQDQGAAYVFSYQAASWSSPATLASETPEGSEFFGYGVAIEGDVIAVGAAQDNEVANDGGAVHLFEWDGAGWSNTALLTGPDQSTQYGRSPAVQGERIAVGALYLDGNTTPQSGAAYVYRRPSGGAFAAGNRMVAEDEAQGARFGASVDLDGDWMVVGADSAQSDRGALYLFEIAP